MSAQGLRLRDITDRWTTDVVLKRDVFSTIERGFHDGAGGRREAILRRIDEVPPWAAPAARAFLKREASALAAIGGLGIAPELLESGRDYLIRSWCPGLPLNLARPKGNVAWPQSARRALALLHRARISHNDLAKEQNWLVDPSGKALLTDFQLSVRFRRRTRLFRVLAYEDLRHLLKHKRTYLPERLTPIERRILARKSLINRIWMSTGKRFYILVTRGALKTRDREGGGVRLDRDAPRLAEALRARAGVVETAIVAYPDRRSGTGLYAFVETTAALNAGDLIGHLLQSGLRDKPPELIQIVDRLPRATDGTIRTEILQLIAMNQVDLIESMVSSEDERALVRRIADGRLNLHDRFRL